MKMKGNCIDFHAHAVTDAFRRAIDELEIDVMKEDGFPLPAWSMERHLHFMEEADVDFSVLSAPVPHLCSRKTDIARAAVRQVNESLAELKNMYPDQVAFVGNVPLPDVEGSLMETAYAMDTLHAAGMKVATNMGGIYLGDPMYDPLMEEWNRRKALIIIHPCRAQLRPENVITGKVAAIYEYPADTTRAVLNMAAHRIMTRFPDIRWIVPHCGAFLPYMSQRFAGVSGILASMGMMESVDIGEELERLYFDIAGDPEPIQLSMLRMIADDSHIVYGSDFPHSPAEVILRKKKHLDQNPEYEGLREQIYGDNGQRLLKGTGHTTGLL